MKFKAMAIIAAAMLVTVSTADARPKHHHYHHRHGGLICGVTQMAHFGITNPRYALAKAWLDFKRTFAHAGAVVVSWRPGRDSAGHQGGHVARIERMIDDKCRAMVTDEKGTYERNICKRQLAIVEPTYGG